MKGRDTSAGDELLGRLKKFTEQLDTLGTPNDLPKVLTVRTVKLNLRPQELTADDVKVIRGKLRVSQGVLAEFLGVSTSTIQDWEQGASPVNGPACRLMVEMSRDVEAWSKRIRELATTATA